MNGSKTCVNTSTRAKASPMTCFSNAVQYKQQFNNICLSIFHRSFDLASIAVGAYIVSPRETISSDFSAVSAIIRNMQNFTATHMMPQFPVAYNSLWWSRLVVLRCSLFYVFHRTLIEKMNSSFIKTTTPWLISIETDQNVRRGHVGAWHVHRGVCMCVRNFKWYKLPLWRPASCLFCAIVRSHLCLLSPCSGLFFV